MADVSYQQSTGRSERGSERTRSGGLRMITRTETRRAFMTTEFWIAVAMAAAVIIAAYKNDGRNLGIDQAWALGSGIIAFYVLSRGVAKAGSSDPDVRDVE